MDYQEQCSLQNILVAWINTIKLDGFEKINQIQELGDGIILFEIMHKIYPDYFDMNLVNNREQIYKNLVLFYSLIENYYEIVLNKKIPIKIRDLQGISLNKNDIELIYLTQNVLGAVVQCPEKDQFIEAILTLSQDDQIHLMTLIQKILNKQNEEKEELKSHEQHLKITQLEEQIQILMGQTQNNSKLLSKIDELELQVQVQQQENSSLIQNNEQQELKIQLLLKKIDQKDEQIKEIKEIQSSAFKQADVQNHQEYQGLLNLKEKLLQEQQTNSEIQNQSQLKKNLELEEEIEHLKKKLQLAQRNEQSLIFYKEKFEQYEQITIQKQNLENLNTSQKYRLVELDSKISNLQSTIEKYKQAIESEQEKCINLELEISRQNSDVQHYREEHIKMQKRLDLQTEKINDLQKQNESHSFQQDLQIPQNNSLKNDFDEIIKNMETRYEQKIFEQQAPVMQKEDDFDLSMAKKEIQLVRDKCKQLSSENQTLKLLAPKIEMVLKLEDENHQLKEKLRSSDQTEALLKKIEQKKKEIQILKNVHKEDNKIKNEEMSIMAGVFYNLAKKL